jgi:hypothetical protein
VESTKLAEIRADALARIARTERWFKAVFCGGAIFELALLAALLLTADLSSRTLGRRPRHPQGGTVESL